MGLSGGNELEIGQGAVSRSWTLTIKIPRNQVWNEALLRSLRQAPLYISRRIKLSKRAIVEACAADSNSGSWCVAFWKRMAFRIMQCTVITTSVSRASIVPS